MDIEKSNFFTDQLLEAIKLISQKQIDQLQFDKTILCTIIDVVDSSTGHYLVSYSGQEEQDSDLYKNGTWSASYFDAYSSGNATYEVNDNVYVVIPENDFSKQKIIIRKYYSDKEIPQSYINPSERIVKFNTVSETAQGNQSQWSLLANNKNETEILLFSKLLENPITANYLAISADFKTELQNFEIYQGLYGLRVQLIGFSDALDEEYKTQIETLQTSYHEAILELESDSELSDEEKILQRKELDQTYISNLQDLKTQESLSALIEQNYLLTSANMFGNPFNYASWSQQESLIDISSFPYPIQGINVFFFQSKVLNQNVPFIDYQLRSIPYQITYPDLDRPAGEEPDLFDNNLFVDNINLYFGDLTTNFKDHELVLYTPSSLKYSEDIEENKELKVRWILNETPDAEVATLISVDELEEEIKNWTIDNSLPIDSAYWDNKVLYLYKYTYGQNEPDPYAGDFWEPIIRWGYKNFKQEETVVNGNPIIVYKYDKSIDRIINKQFDTDQIEFLNDFANLDLESEDFTSPFNISIPLLEFDRQSAITRYKFLIVEYPLSAIEGDKDYYSYDPTARTIYSSNEVIFSNRDQVASQATMALIRGLELVCSDNSNGVYRVYDNLGHIANGARYGEKKLKANFEAINILNLNAGPVTITWQYPKNNTMLLEPSDFDEEKPWNRDADSNWYIYTKQIEDIAETGEEDEVKSIIHSIPYSINMNYYPTRTNNTIQCIIERNGKEYVAEKEFYFGGFGSNGTNYSFDISLEKEYEYDETSDTFTAKSDKLVSFIKTQGQDWVKVKASLLYNNTEITDLSAVKWSWYKKTDDKDFLIINGMTNDFVTGSEIYIEYNKELSLDTDYDYILQAQLTYDIARPQNTGEEIQGEQEDTDKITLTAYLPIGISNDSSIITYQGDSIITYNDYGTLAFYNKEPYKLFQLKNNKITSIDDIIWESIPLNSGNTSQLTGYPDIFQDGNGDWFIRPVNFFVSSIDNICRLVASTDQSAIVFIQPILLLQDRYGNQILNDWNGKLSIDEENNTILSAIMGAGTKDDDNKFSGILMGEVDNNGTGLYGYSHGAQVYGFRENGTAFIGASGGGRIEFDGTKATITSSAYESDGKGMNIDLSLGKIIGTSQQNWGIRDNNGHMLYKYYGEDYYEVLNDGNSEYYRRSDDEPLDYSSLTPEQRKNLKPQSYSNQYIFNASADETNNEVPIQVGEKFKVAWDGTVTMSGAIITDDDGHTYQDLIDNAIANIDLSGQIDLNDYVKFDTTYANSSSSFYLANNSGLLKAKNGFFSGVISAYAGDLGGWVVAPGIMSHGYNMKFYQSGNIYYWKGDFITTSSESNHTINANVDQIGGLLNSDTSRTGVNDDLGTAPMEGVNVKSNGAFIYLRNNGNGITINRFGYENANQSGESLNNIIFSLGKNFAVNRDGDIFAHNGIFSGTVNADNGTIGGWSITSEGIEYIKTTSSGNNTLTSKIILDSTNGLKFLVNEAEQFAVSLFGVLNAVSGTIGGLELNNGALISKNRTNDDTGYMSISPNLDSGNAFKIGSRFWVEADGSIHATHGTFTGAISASQFLGNNIRAARFPDNYYRVWNGKIYHGNYENYGTWGLTINNGDSLSGFWKDALFTKMISYTHSFADDSINLPNNRCYIYNDSGEEVSVTRSHGYGLYVSNGSDGAENSYATEKRMKEIGYDHRTYIGFIRGAGDTSKHPTNVFLGLKSSPYIITEKYVYNTQDKNQASFTSSGIEPGAKRLDNFQNYSIYNDGTARFWSSTDDADLLYSRYNAWIKFNGNAKFRSLTVGGVEGAAGGGAQDIDTVPTGIYGIDHNGNAQFNSIMLNGIKVTSWPKSGNTNSGWQNCIVSNGYLQYYNTKYDTATDNILGLVKAHSVDSEPASGEYGICQIYNGNIYYHNTKYNTATNEILGLVKVGTTLTSTSGYIACPIDSSGKIYYQNTIYSAGTGLSLSNTTFSIKQASGSQLGGVKVSANTFSDDNLIGSTYYPVIMYGGSTEAHKGKIFYQKGTSSDKRLKKNLKLIDNLDLYDNLIPYSFQWKETNLKTYGFIAQDIKNLSEKYQNDSDDLFYTIDTIHSNYINTNKEYCINYDNFHALHIAKNHQQDKRIAQLEQQVAELQNQIEQLLRDKGGN